MFYERLSAKDTTFLRIETDHEPQHVGSLSVLDGAPLRDADGRLRFDELRAHIERRLHRVPRMRQRLMEVPFGQGRPVWVDDAHFDLDFHVRLTSIPRPGDDVQLATLMSRLQSLPIDRARPLWEMWFVDGFADDDVGLVLKTHHALGDGIANVDLALAILDVGEETPDDGEPAPPWSPRPAPTDEQLLRQAVREYMTFPIRAADAAVRALRDPLPAIETTTNAVRTAISFTSKPDDAPWNRDVSPHRRWVSADVPIGGVRAIRERFDVTLNDVVLTACTGALRRFLVDHGADVHDRTLQAMVPISVRGDDERDDTLGNLISVTVVELPVSEPDPARRLELVHTATTEMKESGSAAGADTIIEIADAITPLAGPLTRFVSQQIPMNLVITNIPGPPMPLYFHGARMRRAYPYVEVVDHEGLTIAVLSYDDQLFFGITSDRDVIPDLADVARGIEAEFTLLREL